MFKGYAGDSIYWKIEEVSEQGSGSPQDDGQCFRHVSLRKN